MYYYVTGVGDGKTLVGPAAFGAIMLFGRIVDAIADPLVALWSDNLESKRGRRTPFLLAGGITYVVIYIALFLPPVKRNSPWNAAYLALFLGLYFFIFTVYVCPYLALLPEIARTNKDRVDLSTIKAAFSLFGVAVAMIGSGLLIGALGFHGMLIVLGIFSLVLLYIPLLVKEKEYAHAQPATLKLVRAIKTTFKNRAFRIYLVANVAFWLGFNIITLGVPFYVTVLLGKSEEATALYFGVILGVSALAFPFVNIFAKRYGLKLSMIVSMLLFVIMLPLIYFVGKPAVGLSKEMFALLVMGIAGVPLAGLFVVPDAIVAAVSDLEERLSGERREAMYFGTQGFILKAAMGLSTLLTGLLFQLFGKSTARPLGIQLTGVVASLFILAGLLSFLRYPEKEVNEVQLRQT